MRRYRMGNKFRTALFFLLIIGLLFALVFLWRQIFLLRSGNLKQGASKPTITTASRPAIGQNKAGLAPGDTNANPGNVSVSYLDYQNQPYAYSISYPNNWFVISDYAQDPLKTDPTAGNGIVSGGQVFFSNYKNINDYSPENRPADFHILSLTIYEAQNTTIESFAALLGFDSSTLLKKTDFVGKNISGTEYIAGGADENNPAVAIIFQNGPRFYVFDLGFIGGNIDAATTMENIAKTLLLK